MHSFFSRHEVDKQAEGFRQGEKGYPSNGRIAWALWGGDSGQSWARKKHDQIEREEAKQDDEIDELETHVEAPEDDKALSGKVKEGLKNINRSNATATHKFSLKIQGDFATPSESFRDTET